MHPSWHDVDIIVPTNWVSEKQNNSARYWEHMKIFLGSDKPATCLVISIFWPYYFSGMRHNISVEVMINYLKEWCIKPVDKQELRQPGDDLEGAEFTSTVQHIHNVYNYLYQNCPQGSLKELFQHSPAVFIEFNGYTLTCICMQFQIGIKNKSPLTLPLQTERQLVFRAFLPPEGSVLERPNIHVSALQTAYSCSKWRCPGAQNPRSLLQSTGRHESLLPKCIQTFSCLRNETIYK